MLILDFLIKLMILIFAVMVNFALFMDIMGGKKDDNDF